MMLIQYGLIFILVAIPLIFAAVQPHIWTFYAGIIFVLFSIKLWKNGFAPPPSENKLFVGLIFLFFAFTLFQLLPLPPVILNLLSPFQYQTLQQSSNLLDNPLPWHSLSYVPLASFSWWLFLVSLCLFFLLLKNYLYSQKRIIRITGVMLGLSLLESLYGLFQALIPSLGVLWVDYVTSYLGDARGTFINRNHFAGFIEMVWPLGFGLILAAAHFWNKDRYDRARGVKRMKLFLASDRVGLQLLLWTALLFILLALLFSKSRAGIAGAFIGFVSFLLLVNAGGKRFSWPAWGVMGAGFAFLLFYGNVIGFEKIIGRFLTLGKSAGSRADIWVNTLAIIKDHPFGIGLYNYKHVMPVYNASAPFGIKYLYAHNDYLQLLAESGWPGFIALVTGFYIFLGKSIWRIRKYGHLMDTTRFYIGIGAVSGLISIAFHSFFDFNLQIPANLLYFVVLITLAYMCVWEKKSG